VLKPFHVPAQGKAVRQSFHVARLSKVAYGLHAATRQSPTTQTLGGCFGVFNSVRCCSRLR
jgi:hypothetical protein